MNPNHTPQETLQKAISLHQAGQLEDAKALYAHVLQKDPRNPDALHLSGVLLHQQGDHADAIDLIRAAIHLQPINTGFYLNLANVYRTKGDLTQAAQQYQALLSHYPDHLEGALALGALQAGLQQEEVAQKTFETALAHHPKQPDLLYNLGRLHQTRGREIDAIVLYQQALSAQPDFDLAALNLGSAYQSLGQNRLAEEAYQHGLIYHPHHTQLLSALGMLLYDQGKLTQAQPYFDTLCQLDPQNPLWRFKKNALCPIFPASPAEIAQFRETLADSLEQDLAGWLQSPTPPCTLDELMGLGLEPSFFLPYQGENDLALKTRYADLWQEAFARWYPQWMDPPATVPHPTDGRRIGILVTEKHEGIFLKLMEGMLKAVHRDSLHWSIIAPKSTHQTIDARLKRPDFDYISLPTKPENMIETVRSLGLDVLLYFEVGTDATNYFLPFFHLAPVQCTTWGVPVTTGIPAVDYFLTSRLIEPPEGQDYYRETLVHLDHLPAVFEVPQLPVMAKRRDDFHLPQNAPLYLCPQNLFKLHPDFDALIGTLLEEDPTGHVVFIEGRDPAWTDTLRQRFESTIGHALERIHFLPRLSTDEFLQVISLADVMLDPIHYSGGTTSLEALALGKPIVTWPSPHARSRLTLACYEALGASECLLKTCIVDNHDAYIETAIRLAHDTEYRDAVQGEIRARQHRLYGNTEAARSFETFFETVPLPHRATHQPDLDKLYQEALHHLENGDYPIAKARLETLLSWAPQAWEVWANLGLVHKKQHALTEAISCYERALQLAPQEGILLNNLANAYKEQGNLAYALTLYQQAVTVNPHDAHSWNNLCCGLKEALDWKEALLAAKTLTSLAPHTANSWIQLAEVHFHLGQSLEATQAYQEASRLAPTADAIHLQLGRLLQQTAPQHQDSSLLAEALTHFEAATHLNPDNAHGWYGQGEIHYQANDWAKSLEQFNRYTLLVKQTTAEDLFRQLRLATLSPIIPTSNAEILSVREQMMEQVEKAEAAVLKYLSPFPLDALEASLAEPNFYLIYHGLEDKALRTRLGNLIQTWLEATHPHEMAYTPDPVTQPHRLGFWVTEHHENIFSKLLLGYVAQFDLAHTDLYVFGRPQSLNYLKNKLPESRQSQIHWTPCTGGFQNTLSTLRSARLSAMFYDEVGSTSLNYFLPFFRVAPLQCTANGYPITSGIPAMDVFFTGTWFEEESASSHYSEELVRLPLPPWCFTQPQLSLSHTAASSFDLFGNRTRQDGPIISCPQSLFKIHPDMDPLFGEILKRLPKAKLVLLETSHPRWNQTLEARLIRQGIDPERQVCWLPRLAFADYLKLLNETDVMLDTLHYSGSITTHEALAFGTPLITMPTPYFRGRVTTGCYTAMGWRDCIAQSPQGYVDLAVELASNPSLRQDFRNSILEKNPPLYQVPQAAHTLQQHFQQHWQQGGLA